MAIKLKSNSAYDGQVQETNTAARQYYLPNNDSGLGTQLMTAQATTSGTSVLFSSVPSWCKRITIMLNGVSTSGLSPIQVQLGSGSVTTSGYTSYDTTINSGTGQTSSTTGLLLNAGAAASAVTTGQGVLTLIGSNTWVFSALTLYTNTAGAMSHSAGVIALSGAVDRVNLTTVNGTDTFDAGSINVMYE